MEPEDFLKQAKKLINSNNPSEVEFRSAISRAYYSLYHESMILLKASRHKKLLINKVREHLRKHPPPNHKQIDEKLINDIDTRHLHYLGVPLHYIIPNALQDIDYTIGLDFKSYHVDRKDADYELNRKFSHKDSGYKVQGIEDLIIHIKDKLQAP
jgi:hypothetical protein